MLLKQTAEDFSFSIFQNYFVAEVFSNTNSLANKVEI